MTPGNGAMPCLRPEVELILAAAGVGDREERTARVRTLLRDDLDWSWIVQSSLKNRILPLVRNALLAAGDERVPAESLAELEGWFRRVQLENLRFLQEMLALVACLESHGVDVSPYKGPVLAATLYEDLGLRQFYDLDLLVRMEDLPRVEEILLARSYEAVNERDGEAATRHLEEDCELQFRHQADGLVVEVHWDVLPRRHRLGLEIEEYWERLVPLELAGHTLRVLGPEDLFLVLCIHGGEKHRWVRLQMIADVARLLRTEKLDWRRLSERARAIGRENTVLLGAYLAWSLLEAPLPAEILARAEASAVLRTRAAITLERLIRLDSGLPGYARWRAHARYLAERARARGHASPSTPGLARYAQAVLTPEWTDRVALELPERLGLLYWLYRPWRLWRRHGTRLLLRLAGGPGPRLVPSPSPSRPGRTGDRSGSGSR